MPRLTRQELIDRLCRKFRGTPDPTGQVDVRMPDGVIIVAPSADDIPAGIARLKPLLGYRFLAIHRDDLFVASRATVQTKIGILDETGATLKAADVKLR